MKALAGLALSAALLLPFAAQAESPRCNGDIVDIGDTKIEVFRMCGEPALHSRIRFVSVPLIKFDRIMATTALQNIVKTLRSGLTILAKASSGQISILQKVNFAK